MIIIEAEGLAQFIRSFTPPGPIDNETVYRAMQVMTDFIEQQGKIRNAGEDRAGDAVMGRRLACLSAA